MRKKLIITTLVTLLCFVFTMPVFAISMWDKSPKNYNVKVFINDQHNEVKFPAGMGMPFILGNRTFVPYRIMCESLGAKVDWDETARKVTVNGNNSTVELFINLPNYLVNGKQKTMDVEPFILSAEGRTYIPARYLTEGLNYTIDFAQDGKVMYVCSFTRGQTEAERKKALEEIITASQLDNNYKIGQVFDLGRPDDPAKVEYIKVGDYELRIDNAYTSSYCWFGITDSTYPIKDIRVVCTSHPEWNKNNRLMWDGSRLIKPMDVWTNGFGFFKDGYTPEPKSGDRVTVDVYGKVNGREIKLATIIKTLP